MKRRRFSKEFKARVALEAIKGQRTAAELAQEYGSHQENQAIAFYFYQVKNHTLPMVDQVHLSHTPKASPSSPYHDP